MPGKTTEVKWQLSAEEHAFWLSQARKFDLTVGELIYVLATDAILEGWSVEALPPEAMARVENIPRIDAAVERRRARGRNSSA